MIRRLKLAVLISGGGTTLKNLIDKNADGAIDIDFRLVISSNAKAGGLSFAEAAQIPTHVVRRKSFESAEDHSQAIFELCRTAEVDYVVMGGFLSHVLIPPDFHNRVLNTHPSLIPLFVGVGFTDTMCIKPCWNTVPRFRAAPCTSSITSTITGQSSCNGLFRSN